MKIIYFLLLISLFTSACGQAPTATPTTARPMLAPALAEINTDTPEPTDTPEILPSPTVAPTDIISATVQVTPKSAGKGNKAAKTAQPTVNAAVSSPTNTARPLPTITPTPSKKTATNGKVVCKDGTVINGPKNKADCSQHGGEKKK